MAARVLLALNSESKTGWSLITEREATKGTSPLPDLFCASGHEALDTRGDATVAHILADSYGHVWAPMALGCNHSSTTHTSFSKSDQSRSPLAAGEDALADQLPAEGRGQEGLSLKAGFPGDAELTGLQGGNEPLLQWKS